jgi:catechol 2,3-dioxygenase-like lactoylglutathione lyase family enzyme
MPVPVSKIGHIVLRVEDLDPALAFYRGILGLKEIARRDFGEGPMVFLSTGNSHHDIALVAAHLRSSVTTATTPRTRSLNRPDRRQCARRPRQAWIAQRSHLGVLFTDIGEFVLWTTL